MCEQVILSRREKDICINIIYSSRKTIGIEIKNDLTVNIRVPDRTSRKAVQSVIDRKADWIFKAYEKAQAQAEALGALDKTADLYADGAVLPFKGKERIRLSIIKSGYEDKAQIDYDAYKGILTITTLCEKPEFVRNCTAKVFRQQAKHEIRKRADYFSGLMGVSYNRICIKEQRTKWGSCSSRGNLNFNWKLIMMPEEILDYVVVHELAHRIEMNHSKRFWYEVGKMLPDYREREKWLKMNEKYYIKY